jgi:hypothetical protein
MPSTAWAYGQLRPRCLYTPLSVVGVGERAVALWVQALPVPGIRAVVSFSEISSVVRQTIGTRGRLLVTGCTSRLPVRYETAGGSLIGALTRQLRRRAAGDPAPVLTSDHGARTGACGRPGLSDLAGLRLDSGDDIAIAGRYGRPGRGMCLLAVTPRELVIMRTARSANPFGRLTDLLYIPRRAVSDASIQAGSLTLRSNGVEVAVKLKSRKAAAAASAWLGQVLSDHDHSGTGS